MHSFQLAFQHLFCLCIYYLLVRYIQNISSVAAVCFFLYKNDNCQSSECMKDYEVAWPVFSASFVWSLSHQQPWEAVLNSYLALYQYTKHNSAGRACVVLPPSVPTMLLLLVDFMYGHLGSPQCIFTSSSSKKFVSAAPFFWSSYLNFIKMLKYWLSQYTWRIERDISENWLC